MKNMKTHFNQIFTVVSFFSLSLTTTLAISWGINGFMADEKNAASQCLEQDSAVIRVIQSKTLNIKSNLSIKSLLPKITLKSNG